MSNPSTSSTSPDAQYLPQYGFGSEFAFDVLVDNHRFLYRVHTPKKHHRVGAASALSSRAASPAPSSRTHTPNPTHGHGHPGLTRSPASSLSASVASVRSIGASSDYFTSAPVRQDGEDDDNAAPSDPYFLSRQFKEDLSSPDPVQRRRTLSTLSTLSAGSGVYSYASTSVGSDSEGEDHSSHDGPRRCTLNRSASMILGSSRVRADSLTTSRPGARRSQSVDIRQRSPPTAINASENINIDEGVTMTYSDLIRHLDWTTRSHSPYVTTSFSFFWALWDAVRRYKLGVKHDVEIAIIDAGKVRGRAWTALEVLRKVEGDRQDKAYWKWYRFALESQDVLVFGAIPGDAIYASIPLTHILPKLPSYFFTEDMPKVLVSVEEPEPDAAVDPRSPTARMNNTIVPLPETPHRTRERKLEREKDKERTITTQLLGTLAWDIGTSLKPSHKSKDRSLKGVHPSLSSRTTPEVRYTSHADFCKALSAGFMRRSEAERVRDATTGAVRLARTLIEPWVRARCVEAEELFGGSEWEEGEEEGSMCFGIAGDGCSRESSIQDALFLSHGHNEEGEEEDESASRTEARTVLTDLALSIARWPAKDGWYAEHHEMVCMVIRDVVRMDVEEAAQGVRRRVGWALGEVGSVSAGLNASLSASMGGSGSLSANGERGRRDREASPSPSSRSRTGHVRRASEGSPSPSPKVWPSISRESPYKPRARSPLGTMTPALGPAIIIRPKSTAGTSRDANTSSITKAVNVESTSAATLTSAPEAAGTGQTITTNSDEQTRPSPWSPTTPPPTPPAQLRSVSPPPRTPRSDRRPSSPSYSPSQSLSLSYSSGALPSPTSSINSSPAASLTASSLLKRSVTRRAASVGSIDSIITGATAEENAEHIPGGWPDNDEQGQNSQSAEETDLFWDPSSPPRKMRGRALSWAPSDPISLNENASVSADGDSYDPIRSESEDTHAEREMSGGTEEMLGEVVKAALGLGVGAAAVAATVASAGTSACSASVSGSPHRLETSNAAPSSSSATGSERPVLGLSHHRRHSSHGHPLEMELSPVREVEAEDEEGERDQGVGVGIVEPQVEIERAHDHHLDGPVGSSVSEVDNLEPQHVDGPYHAHDVPEREHPDLDAYIDTHLHIPEQAQGWSTPRSDRRRSRSGTLTSIPEEWMEWALVEAPSEYEGENSSEKKNTGMIGGVERMVEGDVPLPPSPVPEGAELTANDEASPAREEQQSLEEPEDDNTPRQLEDQQVALPKVKVSEEGQDSGDIAGHSAARVDVQTTPHIEEKKSEQSPQTLSSESSDSKEPNKSSTSKALLDIRRLRFPLLIDAFLLPQLTRTRAFLQTFFALPFFTSFKADLLRRVFGTSQTRTETQCEAQCDPESDSNIASPIFEDTDAADKYLRLSPLFSLLRFPFLRSRFSFLQRRLLRLRLRQERRRDDIPLALAPPPIWDTPILGFESCSTSASSSECASDCEFAYDHARNRSLQHHKSDLDGERQREQDEERRHPYWDARDTSWAMSCFVCGLMATLALAAVQHQRLEMHMMFVNRYH